MQQYRPSDGENLNLTEIDCEDEFTSTVAQFALPRPAP